MIEFGKTLREAREMRGLTISQVAENTRMMYSMVEDLENERFGKIAAPIYGRGFVKLYCEAVGIEPKPMIDEFMDIYSGNRELGIKERVTASAPTTPTAPIPEAAPIAAEVPPVTQPLAADPIPAAPEPEMDLFSAAAQANEPPKMEVEEPKPLFSKYSMPVRERLNSGLFSPQTMRLAIIGAGALIAILLIVMIIRGLYSATASKTKANESAAVQTTSEASKALNAGRKPLPVEPLYVD